MSSANNTIQIAALKKQIDFTKNQIIQRGLDIKVLKDNGQPVSKIVKKLMQRIDEMARLLKDIRIKNVTVNNSLLSGLSNEMKKLISEKEAEIASAEGLAAPPPLAPASVPALKLQPSSKQQSTNAFKESAASIKKINLLLGEVEAKANDKNKLSEVQSMIQTIEAEIAKTSESISKIDIGHYKSYVNGTTAEIVRATATKNALQRKVNLIKNGSASALASASASASASLLPLVSAAPAGPVAAPALPPLPPSGPAFFQNLTLAPTSASTSASQPSGPKSVSLHVPVSQGKQAVSASGKLEAGPAAGPKIVRLVRKRDENGTLTYTATIVQSSMSEQLPTNKRWITPGGVSVPALTVNPLFNPLSKGGRKRTHKRK